LDQGESAKNIIRKILPPFPSEKPSDLIFVYGNEIFLSENDARAYGAEANQTDWTVSTVAYSISSHAQSTKIPRERGNMADAPLDLLADSVTTLTVKSSLNEEVTGAAALTTAMTNAGYVLDQSKSPWNTSDFDPYRFLKSEVDRVSLQGGIDVNVLMIAPPIWTAVRTNPNVTGLISGAPQVTNAMVSLAQFAELLGIDEVIVGRRKYATTLNGAKQWIWGQKAMLFHRPSNPGLRTPALGYTPIWTKALSTVTGLASVPGMDGMGDSFVQQYFWEPEIADYVVVHRNYDQEIFMPQLGCLYTGCGGTAGA
jgi:hypothetical protein